MVASGLYTRLLRPSVCVGVEVIDALLTDLLSVIVIMIMETVMVALIMLTQILMANNVGFDNDA